MEHTEKSCYSYQILANDYGMNNRIVFSVDFMLLLMIYTYSTYYKNSLLLILLLLLLILVLLTN